MRFKKFLVFILMMIAVFIFKPSEGKAENIVNPNQLYTYEVMVQDIKALGERYPDIIKYKTIGNSEYGRPIYAVSLGTGSANVFINGSHHAREWITTNLNMYMLDQYAQMYKGNQALGEYNVKKILDETTIWFVPMVNPDGVTLQQFGLSKFPSNVHSSLLSMNEGSNDFKRWKANAKGVDLNRQYNADWANIKNNSLSPSWSNHKGTAPEQAAETKALVKFTKEIDPEMTIAYHSSGEVLYWNFHQSGTIYTRDHTYANKMGLLTGYRLIYPGPNPSGGGYTDWFIIKYNRPGFTPELGTPAGNTNVPLSEFNRIWGQNKYIGLYSAQEGYKLYVARGGKPKPREVNVQIDGQLVQFDQPALLVDGSTLVPVRGVFEHLGAVLEWDDKTNTILARKGTTLVELKIGSESMIVNGSAKPLDVAPQIFNSRTLIPLRAVSESLGAEVGWDSQTYTALITSPPSEEDVTPPVPPIVNGMNDMSQSITGSSETNATIVVKKDGAVIGQSIINADGQFNIPIGFQKSNSILSVSATDLAGNTSAETQITVAFTDTFTDTVNHWAKEPIGYLKEQGITSGYPDGSFGVSKKISRGEAATFLSRTLKLDTENVINPSFPDVPENHQFYKHIAAIFNQNIMRGFPNGHFKPNDTLTRAEMATILVNSFGLTSKSDTNFSDVNRNHWAYEAINILASNGLSTGYPDGTFKADNPIQRAEFGALLARVLQVQPIPVEETNEEVVSPDSEAAVKVDKIYESSDDMQMDSVQTP